VLFGLRAEAQAVDQFGHFAQVIAALDTVLDLAEYFADLVFDGEGRGGALLETVQVRKELGVDEVAQVVAGHRVVVVGLAGCGLWRGPTFPTVGRIEDEAVLLAFERSFGGLVLLHRVEVFEEEQPRALLGVVQFAGAARVLMQDVVDVFEGLFEHFFLAPHWH